MCRFVAYMGEESVPLGHLIANPTHSLIKQSHSAKETGKIMNADGFGVAWYGKLAEPGVFKSIQPAWSDENLTHLSRSVDSRCFVGHIRASTVGGVSKQNCHPFTYGKYSFVHNGTIQHFPKMKRALLQLLDEQIFLQIRGETDSECLFFLIMHFLHQEENVSLAEAVQSAFSWLETQVEKVGGYLQLNILLTDGHELIATRFISEGKKPLSLSFSHNDKVLVVASEVMEDVADNWETIPSNHYLHAGVGQRPIIKKFE